MRVALTTIGSTGDVQPLLVLATTLRRRGHTNVLALPPNFEPVVTAAGHDFAPMGPEIDAATIRATSCGMNADANPAHQVQRFMNVVVPIAQRQYRDLLRTVEDADVLISSPYHFAGRMVHDTTGIPYVSVHISCLTDLGSKVVRGAADAINRTRAAEGLPPLDDPLGADGRSRQLALYCISNQLTRKPKTWPAHCHIVGFFIQQLDGWQPDLRLRTFMEDGEPPVVVSFGSSIHEDPDAMTATIVGAVTDVGCRAVIQRGWSSLGGGTLPDSVITVGTVPHGWLFPRASLIVNHGGIGTIGASLHAGVPMVVVPHMLDQPIWGAVVKALGCATAVIPLASLTREALAAAIRSGLRNGPARGAAQRVASRVRAENGVERACELIETEMARGRRSGAA